MRIFNHLRTREAQRAVAAVALGKHYFRGHTGTSYPNAEADKAIVRQILGDGGAYGWHRLLGAWYDGVPLPAANIKFLPGTTPQTGDASLFPDDAPHPGFCIADFTTPDGLRIEGISESNAPDKFNAIAETLLCPNWDANGNIIDVSYTENPARQWMTLFLIFGKRRHSRINWQSWTQWRDFLGGNEWVDLTTIPGEPGSGVTAEFYDGTNFETLKARRIDAGIHVNSTMGTPAYGMTPGNNSAKYFAHLKPPASGEWQFTLSFDDGARVWLDGAQKVNQWHDDGVGPTGTATFTATLSSKQFYPIELHWNNGVTLGAFRLEWECAGADIAKQVVPTSAFYPKGENQPRYQGHHEFGAPFDLDTALKQIEKYSNSFTQDADGKISFYCLDNLAPTFTFDESNIDLKTFVPERRELRVTELKNVYECRFRDVYSQYLDFNRTPVVVVATELQRLAGYPIEGEPLEFPAMSRWQARKVLTRIVAREIINDLLGNFTGTALTYPVLPGDLVAFNLKSAGADWTDKIFQVLRAVDNNDQLLTRSFSVQEWS